MKIAFIARSTLFSIPGGDTVQIKETARNLILLGIQVDVLLTGQQINYSKYDLLHFFNITRPADILHHINKSKKPFVVSPIFVDYSEFDSAHRKGISGIILRNLSSYKIEYAKTIGRWMLGRDLLRTKSYVLKGQRKCIREILQKSSLILPNSHLEYTNLQLKFNVDCDYQIVPNGIDEDVFSTTIKINKDQNLLLCAARIEGIKNQLNLIKAVNNSSYSLIIVGSPAPGQLAYYRQCKKTASSNVQFHSHVTQQILKEYYQSANVHILPSWFETCGLSTLEAAAMDCKVIITDRGYTKEYFGDDAFYCDPSDPNSIYDSIEMAVNSPSRNTLKEKILTGYTWKHSAAKTLEAYNKIKY